MKPVNPPPALPEGQEKRAVIAPGWTPPAASTVNTVPGRTWQDCKQAAAGKALTTAELADDATNRLAEGLASALE